MEFFQSIQHLLSSYDILGMIRDFLDFLIIAIVIYWLLYFLRGTRSANVLFGLTALFAVGGVLANHLKLVVLGYLMNGIWTILGVAIVVIFQPELRRVLAQAGSIFSSHNTNSSETIDEVVHAVMQMSATKTGCLIVFEKNIGLANIVNTSVALDAKVNSLLLQTIFFKNSPLHDCAVIIRKNHIVAARAVLPLTQEDSNNPARGLGTRHRAAVGISEETDAVSVVVSEESGLITVVNKGRIVRGYEQENLRKTLYSLLSIKEFGNRKPENNMSPLTGSSSENPFSDHKNGGL